MQDKKTVNSKENKNQNKTKKNPFQPIILQLSKMKAK